MASIATAPVNTACQTRNLHARVPRPDAARSLRSASRARALHRPRCNESAAVSVRLHLRDAAHVRRRGDEPDRQHGRRRWRKLRHSAAARPHGCRDHVLRHRGRGASARAGVRHHARDRRSRDVPAAHRRRRVREDRLLGAAEHRCGDRCVPAGVLHSQHAGCRARCELALPHRRACACQPALRRARA